MHPPGMTYLKMTEYVPGFADDFTKCLDPFNHLLISEAEERVLKRDGNSFSKSVGQLVKIR